jgi:ferritin-like protein
MEILLAALNDDWVTQFYMVCTAVATFWFVGATRI